MDKLRVTLKSTVPWKKLCEKMQTCWVGGMCMLHVHMYVACSCACGMCMWHVHVHVACSCACVCDMCMWYVYVACACDMCIWHLACACGMFMCMWHVLRVCGMVVMPLGLNQKLKTCLANELMVTRTDIWCCCWGCL